MVTVELAKTILSVLTVLVTIIVSRKFLSILTKAIEGEVAADTLFVLLGLKMVTATIILLPPSLFLAMLMVFGRMYRDQEMTIFASSGVGLARMYRSVAYFVLPLSLLAGYLALDVMPRAEREAQTLMHKDEQTADVRGIKPGRFNEFSKGDVVLYAEGLSKDDQTLTNLFVQSRNGDETGVVVAENGYIKENELGEHFVVLRYGKRYQGVPGQQDYIISEFEDYAVRIDEGDSEDAALKREAEPTANLWRSQTPRELAELQKRLAVPFGTLLLGILAIPLSRVAPRGGVYGNVMIAFLIYMVYENLQRVSQGLLMTGKIPLWLSYSAVYLLMTAVVLFYLIRAYGPSYLWQRWRGQVVRA
ncbi:MAG: lptF [Proteobacteria bacterium]|nr:lptF [Pseudomonadota bacterium]